MGICRSRRILPLTTINHGAIWLRKRLGLLPQRIDDGEEGEAVEVGVASANSADAVLAHQDRGAEGVHCAIVI